MSEEDANCRRPVGQVRGRRHCLLLFDSLHTETAPLAQAHATQVDQAPFRPAVEFLPFVLVHGVS